MVMAYVEEYGKKIRCPHLLRITGEHILSLFTVNQTPFDNWLRPEVKLWLNDLPEIEKNTWVPRWWPWKVYLPAWRAYRPHVIQRFEVTKYGRLMTTREYCAEITFVRKEDAVKFKLTWA